MDRLISCEFNMDTACVELKFFDGSKIAIDMKAFIERIEMFPEKRKDGSWIKKIVFNFPVPVDGEEVKELPLETETTVETVCLLTKE